jgi:hypothetical protein
MGLLKEIRDGFQDSAVPMATSLSRMNVSTYCITANPLTQGLGVGLCNNPRQRLEKAESFSNSFGVIYSSISKGTV